MLTIQNNQKISALLKTENAVCIIILFVLLCSILSLFLRATFFLGVSIYHDLHFPWHLMWNSGYELTPWKYLTALILAPAFETIFFIVLVHRISVRFNVNAIAFVLVSATTFGVFHVEPLFRVISTGLTGVMFAICYLRVHSITKSENKAAYTVMIVHSLHNLIWLHI